MLTFADKEGRGDVENADIGGQKGAGGLANKDSTNKNALTG